MLFGIALVVWAFGWTGGQALVGDSYTDAKTKMAEQKAQRAAKKEAEQAEDGEGREGCGAACEAARTAARTRTTPRDRGRRRDACRRSSAELHPVRLLVAWLLSAAALLFAAGLLPGVSIETAAGPLLAALADRDPERVLPPLVAALRLPFTLVLGFLLVLVLDAAMFMLAAEIAPNAITVDSFWWALLAALVASAASRRPRPALPDERRRDLHAARDAADRAPDRRQSRTDEPGIIFLEIDGLALPVLRRAMRDGNAPEMARWLAEGGYALTEWETDLSSQTGASQAGILLGSNEDIPAFRWVEKETGRTMTCSKPADCAEIERRRSTGIGLLRDGGASRGNLLSGEADHVILTVSRIDEEKRANPGYRAFLANGFNVTRLLVLFVWEVVLEWTAAPRERAAATSGRAATAAACTRSCAPRCASSSAT